jgi:bifunctional DNA-binding transcriptional regulator/antitoxin component of YhaV-PrlF toxin-antitoxin module
MSRMTAAEHLMTISQNGQVSIPAETRARWHTRRVIVVDLGDRVVMRPAPEQEGIAELQGKYAGRGPDSATARKAARRADATTARRRG